MTQYKVVRKGFTIDKIHGKKKPGDTVTSEELENVPERIVDFMLENRWIERIDEETEQPDPSKQKAREEPEQPPPKETKTPKKRR